MVPENIKNSKVVLVYKKVINHYLIGRLWVLLYTSLYLVCIIICEFNCDETSPYYDYVLNYAKCKLLPHHKPIGGQKNRLLQTGREVWGGVFNCVKLVEREKKRETRIWWGSKKTVLGNKTKVSFSVCLFF